MNITNRRKNRRD